MAYSISAKQILRKLELTAAQLANIQALSTTELASIDGVTAGTVTASKAVIVDSNKDASAFRNIGLVNLDAGSSGVAGSVDIFPTTASKGKLALTVTDQTGDTTVGLVIGAMAAARTITLADPGATANIITSTGIGGTQVSRCTTQIDATSGTTGTTLTNVTGLTATVLAAGVYAFEAYITGVGTANSGMKLAIGGTATATTISYNGKNNNGVTVNANTTTTTLGNAVGAATAAFVDGAIKGTIVVNAAGTLTVQFAQNASHADTTSVFVNSHFKVTRIA